MIGTVFSKLLSNCVVHCTRTPVQVEISTQQLGTEVPVSVEHKGVGIDLERWGHIHQPVRQRRFTNSKGGLGLPIFRKIVEGHHGRIWLDRCSDRGTTFCVGLPLATDDLVAGSLRVTWVVGNCWASQKVARPLWRVLLKLPRVKPFVLSGASVRRCPWPPMNRALLIATSVFGFGLACSSANDPAATPAGASGFAASTQLAASGGSAGSGVEREDQTATATAATPSDSEGGSAEGPGLSDQITRMVALAQVPIVVEIDSVERLRPYEDSESHLVALLEQVVAKPGLVSFEYDEVLPAVGSDYEWTFETLRSYAAEHAQGQREGEARIHVLSVDGRYAVPGGGTVLGLAWSNRYIALFQDAIRSRCTGSIAALQEQICQLAERSVWAHEFGHVLGLVDNGLPMVQDHKDPEHGSHERTEGCLMYWAYEGPALFDTLVERLNTNEEELTFCQASLADVEAAR